MKISISLVAAALCLSSGCGCGNRALPGDGDGDAGTDAGLRDGASGDGHRDGAAGDGMASRTCDAQDARQGPFACGVFLGYAWDGDDCIGLSCACEGTDCNALYQTYGACLGDYAACLPASCTSQRIDYCSEPCMSVAGVWWNGEFCQPIVCCCEGADCEQTWSTWQTCLDAQRECTMNACAATGGYCDYGDEVLPTCLEGYGRDDGIADGTCGEGVCCAPCPVDGVAYVSHDPSECARLDFRCETGWVGFDNECGCGCRP